MSLLSPENHEMLVAAKPHLIRYLKTMQSKTAITKDIQEEAPNCQVALTEKMQSLQNAFLELTKQQRGLALECEKAGMTLIDQLATFPVLPFVNEAEVISSISEAVGPRHIIGKAQMGDSQIYSLMFQSDHAQALLDALIDVEYVKTDITLIDKHAPTSPFMIFGTETIKDIDAALSYLNDL